jgi:parallel beta-helix repeat protein
MQNAILRKGLVVIIVFFVVFSGTSIAKCTTIENEGSSNFPATGFFYVKNVSGVWWFINSTGNKFFAVGVAGVGPGEFYCGNNSAWYKIAKERLGEWRFNSMMGSQPEHSEYFAGVPYVCRVGTMEFIVNENGWVNNSRFPDVFNPDWKKAVRSNFNETAKIYRNDSDLIGYTTGNEMKWGPDIVNERTLLELYMAASNKTFGKQKVVNFLSERYEDNICEFNRVWNMNITDFNDLLNLTKFGIEGWRVQSSLWSAKLKLFRENSRLLRPYLLKKAEKDIKDFSRLVAETYFNITNNALHAADPNHLNLGVRFHQYGVPVEVLEECGKYVDVISVNYYRPSNDLISLKYGCVPLDHWMRKYYEITHKPLMNQEGRFAIDLLNNDGSWPSDSKIFARTFADVQKNRVVLYKLYASNCQNSPYMVGQGFFFTYRDPIDAGYGLVNLWDEPYTDFVSKINQSNSKAIENHENATHTNSYINELSDTNFLSDSMSLVLDSDKKIVDAPFALETFPSNSDEEYYMHRSDPDRSYSYYVDIAHTLDDRKTLYVGGNGSNNYTKIQDAIDNTSNGDTIVVYNGTYHEKLIIDKSIFLGGKDKNGTIISGIYEGLDNKYHNRVITIGADHVTVTGFNITTENGSIDHSGNYHACSFIYIKKYNDTNISGNIMFKPGGWDSGWGVMSLKSDYNTITHNTFYGMQSLRDCGIIMDRSNNSLISDNTFIDNVMYGIWISSCKNNTIQHNTVVSNPHFGIFLWRAHHNIIFGNTIQKIKQSSICLKESNNNSIISNNFLNNTMLSNFFYSYDNFWDGNYWGRPMIFPKLIFGKLERNFFIHAINVDHHPLQEPYGP